MAEEPIADFVLRPCQSTQMVTKLFIFLLSVFSRRQEGRKTQASVMQNLINIMYSRNGLA